jgi:hypothetical protein
VRETPDGWKTNQNLKAGVGWKSSNGEMVPSEVIKERKGWERFSEGMDEDGSSLCSGSGSEWRKGCHLSIASQVARVEN